MLSIRDSKLVHTDLRHRIELIQDFHMPTASTHVQLTNDGEYIMAAGVYKPRVCCYDTHQLSLKFERCLTSEGQRLCMPEKNVLYLP